MNSNTVKEIRSALGLSNLDSIPSTQCVVNVNPKDYKFIKQSVTNTQTSTGGVNFYTTHATRNTYLTNLTYSFAKNATCDVATGALTVYGYFNNVLTNLLSLAVITTTDDSQTVTLNFNTPLLLDKNSVVGMSGTFTAGVLVRCASIQFYEIEDYE